MREQIVYLSGAARAAITALVVIVFACSLALVAYLLWVHPSGMENMVGAGLSLANTAATGMAFLVVLFLSRLSVDVAGLKEKSDAFLLADLVEAFRTVDYDTPPFSAGTAPALAEASRVKTTVSYVKSTSMARYKLEAFGRVQDITVMLNVRRMVVSFSFPPGYEAGDPRLAEVFDYTVKGAEHAGYAMEWRMMGGPADRHLELRALVNLPVDFLANSAEKLFWSNDVAIMARSVVKCRLIYESGPMPASAAA